MASIGRRYFCALCVLAGSAVFAQEPARPRFDVASIKPSEERGNMYVRTLPGGRLVVNAPVRLMLLNAYGIQFSQLVAAPDWLSSDIWSVDARVEGNRTREEMMLMLQGLLEDRFQLKIHRENKEMPVYALTVAKSGPKLPAPKEGTCATPVPGKPEPTLPPCGRVRISMASGGVLIEGGSSPISELTRTLAIPLNRPVVNRTGLTGAYDIKLQFAREADASTPPPEDAPSAGIYTAIQEQLGLKLESAKAPVEVVVIDRIARPTAN